ncbi:unnamed protein product [Didymodactylos carnosus]|uniref:Uncharacterized protein n=1 Tax=Didymodactylos carnosus TaxID=1234261 RepID=A0A8S2DY80_9BILA|nr:unnamed protein product [Didymodactylos carnosus]CAF3831618.1 unnamed protein product [Didymodactylos carnosus]
MKIQLRPESDGYKNWIESPVTTTRAYRLFNVTNYKTIMTNPSSPMEIQETDPFMYKLSIKKNDIDWSDDNSEVSYSVERLFERIDTFNEALLNEKGAFVDIPRLLFRTKFDPKAHENMFIGAGYNVFDNHTRAVDLIEGFASRIFAFIQAQMVGPNTDKYGYIYRVSMYNGSRGYNFTIRTGSDNLMEKGRVVDYKSEYKYNFSFYDGLTFPPLNNPTKMPAINIFQADFCRPIQLRYNQTLPMFGLNAVHEYVLRLVDHETCSDMNVTCEESQYLDISKCFSETLKDAFYLSKPHMYTTNTSLPTNWNVNFIPDKDRHESTVYFEPITGTPIKAQLRVQLNARTYVDKIEVDIHENTKVIDAEGVKRIIPMFWIDQTITLNDATLSKFIHINQLMHTGRRFYETFKVGYIIVSFLLCLALIAFLEMMHYFRQNQSSMEETITLSQKTMKSSPEQQRLVRTMPTEVIHNIVVA